MFIATYFFTFINIYFRHKKKPSGEGFGYISGSAFTFLMTP